MRARTILINLLIVIALLSIIELVSRYVLSRIYNRSFDSSLIEEYKYGNSDGLKANASSMIWSKGFNTDELGGRVCAGNKSKPKRLYIGDSVTEGVGVDDTSAFAYKMSTIDTSNDVRNISLIGYSTADYVNAIRYYINADSTIGSIIVFYCLNDVYGKTAAKNLPTIAKQNLLGKINGLLQNNYATYKLLKLFVYQNSNSYYRYDAQFYAEGNAMFKQAMADLKTCDSLCSSTNIQFNVVVMPYRSQFYNKGLGPQHFIKKYCEGNKIVCYDAKGYLSKYPPKQLYLFADEIHFSAKGHQKIAEYLQTIGL